MSLASWSDIIRRQGEESRKRQDDKIKAIRKGIPAKIEEFSSMPDRELLKHHEEYHGRQYCHDPREAKLWARIIKASRKEILNRMA